MVPASAEGLWSLPLACTLALLAGCGGAADAGRAGPPGSGAAKPAGGVLASRTFHAPSRARAQGAAVRGTRPFARTSFWNKALPPDATLDPHSAEMAARLSDEVAQEQASKHGPWINATSYGVPLVTVGAGQPTTTVMLDHAPDAALSEAWSSVPLPPSAQAAQGSDGYMVVWQPSTDRMWEFWQLSRQSDGWHASWGGAMMHVSQNQGVYGPGAWPGAKPWWGATASSLALAGGVMSIEELGRGRINHALAIALPEVRAGVFASPAQRTDGRSGNPLALPEGAHLRLDPQLDLSTLSMPPVVRQMAVAAQRYGILVRDVSANVAFIAQDPSGTGSDPYTDGFYEGKYPSELLASFPWAHLQVLKMDLHSLP